MANKCDNLLLLISLSFTGKKKKLKIENEVISEDFNL
jgi:hypothetical protein